MQVQLREVTVVVDGVSDKSKRETLRASCIRAYSALAAELPRLATERTGKVNLLLRAATDDLPVDSSHVDESINSVMTIEETVDIDALLRLSADERAVHLLDRLRDTLRSLALKHAWDIDRIHNAYRLAVEGGVTARLRRPQKLHSSKKFAAEAEGQIDEEGMHISLRIVSPADGATTLCRATQVERGDWYRLLDGLAGVTWQGEVATVVRKRGKERYFLPPLTLTLTDDQQR